MCQLRIFFNIFRVAILLVSLWLLPTHQVSSASSSEVYILELNDDTINPITQEYIVSSLDKAALAGARAVLIKLDTPGGLLSSTRSICKKILSSKVPVVVYIAPSGSRAGSAGVFITYAAHVAAMAPSTNIGAAHPVEFGGGRQGKHRKFLNGIDFQGDKTENKQKDDGERVVEKNPKASAKKTDQNLSPNKKLNKESVSGQNRSPQEKQKAVEENALEEETEDLLSEKILNDTVAFIKAMAKLRNRNLEWAVKSVTESSSITETEAKEKGVIEIIAKDDNDLMEQLEGRTVKIGKNEIILKTKDAQLTKIDMDYRQKFFNVLANPNIVYIFLILGFYGLLYEITHPGFGIPGVIGATLLILAFFSMQALPTNYAALALIVLGLVFFIVEAYTPGFGIMALGGIVCMILGSLLLFNTPVPVLKVSLSIILTFTLTTAAITIFLAGAALKAHRRKKMGGQEGLVGEKGTAYTDILPGEGGKVFVHGEIWNATAREVIKKDEGIIVTHIQGLNLTVKKI